MRGGFFNAQWCLSNGSRAVLVGRRRLAKRRLYDASRNVIVEQRCSAKRMAGHLFAIRGWDFWFYAIVCSCEIWDCVI